MNSLVKVAKLRPVKHRKNTGDMLVSLRMKSQLRKLKTRIQENINGSLPQNDLLTYENYGMICFSFCRLSVELGLNSIWRYHCFVAVMYLSIERPSLCYTYYIGEMLGLNPRQSQLSLKYLVDIGLITSYRGAQSNASFFCLSTPCIERVLKHLDELKSAPFE